MNEKDSIGLSISELEYRNLPFPSYSLLSDIAKVGGNAVGTVRNKDINELDGVMVGKLVDNLLTEHKLPDDFYVVKKKPTGKAKDLLKLLSKNSKFLPNENKLFHKDNHDLINKCCDIVGYYKASKNKTDEETWNKRLDGLKNYKEYYDVLNKAPEDSFIISDYLYYQARKTVDILKKKYDLIFDKPELAGLRVIPQVKLLGEYNKTKIKGMLDFVVIDDANKILTPYDLKTGSYNANDFFEKGYLGWNYYIQSSLYLELLKEELKNHPIYKDYIVTDFVFVFCGRLDGSVDHLIVTPNMHENALKGFEVNNIAYKGVSELCLEFEHYNKK